MVRKTGKVLAASVASLVAVVGLGMGFTQTASAAEISVDTDTSYGVASRFTSSITPKSFDPGHPQNPVHPHHYGPYKSMHDCSYALADQSGSRNVARGCMRENNGGYYYWGWGAGERH